MILVRYRGPCGECGESQSLFVRVGNRDSSLDLCENCLAAAARLFAAPRDLRESYGLPDDPTIILTRTSDACPVQYDVSADGHEFYFRARGNGWRFEEMVDETWVHSKVLLDGYVDTMFAAGYMPELAEALIRWGISVWRHERPRVEEGA